MWAKTSSQWERQKIICFKIVDYNKSLLVCRRICYQHSTECSQILWKYLLQYFHPKNQLEHTIVYVTQSNSFPLYNFPQGIIQLFLSCRKIHLSAVIPGVVLPFQYSGAWVAVISENRTDCKPSRKQLVFFPPTFFYINHPLQLTAWCTKSSLGRLFRSPISIRYVITVWSPMQLS